MKNKKLVAVLTLLCFLFTLMPTMALAANASAVTVSGVTLTGDNKYVVSGGTEAQTNAPTEGGYAYFNNGTLTLNNYNGTSSGGSGISVYGDLNIVLKGSNTININDANESHDATGISTGKSNGKITISGDDGAILKLTDSNTDSSQFYSSAGIFTQAKDINITGNITLTIEGFDYAFNSIANVVGGYEFGTITLGNGSDNPTVIAQGDYNAVRANMIVNSGTAELSGGKRAVNGTLTVSDSNTDAIIKAGSDAASANIVTTYNGDKYVKVVPNVTYPVWVGSTQVTSENCNTNDTWSYDAKTETLTLNNFTSTSLYIDGKYTYGIYVTKQDLNIVLKGNNVIQGVAGTPIQDGIKAVGYKVTISDDITDEEESVLMIIGRDTRNDGSGIYAGNIEVKNNAKVTVKRFGYALNGSVTVGNTDNTDNTIVTAYGNTYAVLGSITVNSGSAELLGVSEAVTSSVNKYDDAEVIAGKNGAVAQKIDTNSSPQEYVRVTKKSVANNPIYFVTVTDNQTSSNPAYADDIAYVKNETVTVTANAVSEKVFNNWTGGATDNTANVTAVRFADASAARTTFSMVDYDLTVTANYGDATDNTEYNVIVENGTGSGKYEAGATVTIVATVPTDKHFVKWTTESITLNNNESKEITFTMPSSDVIITANSVEHSYNVLTNDDTNHWYKCEGCDAIDASTQAKHNYTVLQNDENSSWNKCEVCDATSAKVAHNYGDDNICDDCDYLKDIVSEEDDKEDTEDKDDSDSTPSTSTSGGGFSGVYNYPVVAGAIEYADVFFSKNYAVAGTTVTITVAPEAGKQVDTVTVIDKDGDEITVTKVGENEYTFTMPASKVTVNVTTEAADADTAADEDKTEIVLQIGSKKVLVNNHAINNDVVPVLKDGRTLVPIRIIVETMGGDVDWDAATRTVTLTIDGKVLKLVIDEHIPGFGQGATIMDNRTYVPIRYIGQYIGADVEWIAATQQIVIQK